MITAIIGHGRSPEGKGWGPKIDSCDRVVRMWDCAWQDPETYGSKYDVGLIEIHPQILPDFWRYNRRMPELGWICSDLWIYRTHRRDGLILPDDSEIIDQHDLWTYRYGEQLGACGASGRWELTRGGIATCWAITHSEPGDSVLLVGCDNLWGGRTLPIKEGFPEAYRADPATETFSHYVAGVTKHGNHDLPGERRLYELLAEKHGVEVSFAQDMW